MKQKAKKIVAGLMIFAGAFLSIGSIGTMEVNSYLGKLDEPIVAKLLLVGVFLLGFGSYYAYVLSVRLEKYGKC